MPIKKNFNRSIWLQITLYPQLDNIESDIHTIFIGKHSFFFTVFFGIISNPVVSVCYYHLPFFSNVETDKVDFSDCFQDIMANSSKYLHLVLVSQTLVTFSYYSCLPPVVLAAKQAANPMTGKSLTNISRY